jgi:hypothetical protein
MRKVCIILFLSNLFTNLTFSQTEKYDISFKPEIGITYTIKYKITQDIEYDNFGIINNNGRILEIMEEEKMESKYQLNQSFFLDIKLLNKELDTLFYQYTFRNFKINMESKDSQPMIKDLTKTVVDLSNYFNNFTQMVLKLKSYPKNEKFNNEIVFLSIDDNLYTSPEEIEEIKKELESFESFNNVVNNFLIQYPTQSVSINDSWFDTEKYEFEMDLGLEIKTTYTLKEITEHLYIIEASSFLDDTFEVNSENIRSDIQMIMDINSIYHIDKESGWVLKMTSKSNSNGITDFWFNNLMDEDNSEIKFGTRMKIKEIGSIYLDGSKIEQ